ncbi:MAG: ferredoxin-type protein NapF [Betaproteobacteria bacterium]|nr:ferredoxin-type protein NapF [Betaproteobacteria bacterium]
MGRRAFLRGQRLCRIVAPYRPPWAMAEAFFTRACTRCGACVMACPTGLLTQGTGGFPEANFQRARCTFCADCAHACAENAQQSTSPQPPALAFSPDLPPWTLHATVSSACLPHRGVLCRSCEGHCEAGAIRFVPRPGSPAQPDITGSHCTGCGECVASCPVHAISMQAFPPHNPSGLHSTPFPEKPPQ